MELLDQSLAILPRLTQQRPYDVAERMGIFWGRLDFGGTW